MAKVEKPNFSSFTKAELIRTIKTLSARETKHLNTIAKLQRVADDAAKLVGELENRNVLRASDSEIIWLRDVDGTGSMHPCAKGDEGATGFVPLSPLQVQRAVLKRHRLETLDDMAALDKALDGKGVHVRASKPDLGLDVSPKFPWEN